MPERNERLPSNKRRGSRAGKFNDARTAWATTYNIEAVVYEYEPDTGDLDVTAEELGQDIVLLIRPIRKGREVVMDLSSLTYEELTALKQAFDFAFDKATPVTQRRDELARRAFEEEGDDSYARLYRQVSPFTVRPRAQQEHDQGVQDRRGDVPDVGAGEGPHA